MIGSISLGAEPAALAFIAALVLVTGRNIGGLVRILQWRVFYVLGRASFSIYLAHMPFLLVLNVILRKVEAELGIPLGSDWRIFIPIALCGAALVGIAAYLLVEMRFETRRAKLNR